MTELPTSSQLLEDAMDSARNLVQALLIFALFHATTPAHGDDWPQWRGPNRADVWNETNVMQTFPADGLAYSWRVPVGRGWSSPVVADGRVYVTDVQLNSPAVTERVLCLEENTGKELWVHTDAVEYPEWAFDPNAGGPRATPLVHDGKLFTRGATSRLFCLDAATGAVVWENDLSAKYQLEPFSGITSSPMIEGDLLILFIFGKPDASVIASDVRSGKEVWRALEEGFSYASPMIVSAAGKRQLIVWTQESVTSLDPATGNAWWREAARTPGDLAVATPVAEGYRLLVSGLMLQLAADRPAAKVLWPESLAAMKRVFSNTSTPLLQGDFIYAARYSGELVCVEAATGKQLWQTNSVTDRGNGSSIHLTPNGDSVLLFTNEGNLIRARLAASGYEELSRTHLIDPTHPFNGRNVTWAPPAFANGHVFARNDRELVRASLREQ